MLLVVVIVQRWLVVHSGKLRLCCNAAWSRFGRNAESLLYVHMKETQAPTQIDKVAGSSKIRNSDPHGESSLTCTKEEQMGS